MTQNLPTYDDFYLLLFTDKAKNMISCLASILENSTNGNIQEIDSIVLFSINKYSGFFLRPVEMEDSIQFTIHYDIAILNTIEEEKVVDFLVAFRDLMYNALKNVKIEVRVPIRHYNSH